MKTRIQYRAIVPALLLFAAHHAAGDTFTFNVSVTPSTVRWASRYTGAEV